MAKDIKTSNLMELGESVKASYLKKTDKISTAFLMDGIEIINTCEVNYKSVNNIRVHIEFMLMQLTSLHFNGEKKKAL